MMKLSVVIPAYNASPTIEKAVKSVALGFNGPIEIIVVDDNSSDSTPQKCLYLHRLYANNTRVKFLSTRTKGIGPGPARNIGVEIASGTYVAFCDSDDSVPFGCYSKALQEIGSYRPDIIWGNHINISTRERHVHTFNKLSRYANVLDQTEWLKRMDVNSFKVLWNKLYKVSTLKAFGICLPDRITGEDALFNVELFSRNISLVAVPVELYCYHTASANSVTHQQRVLAIQIQLELTLLRSIYTFCETLKKEPTSVNSFYSQEIYLFLNMLRKLRVDRKTLLSIRVRDETISNMIEDFHCTFPRYIARKLLFLIYYTKH